MAVRKGTPTAAEQQLASEQAIAGIVSDDVRQAADKRAAAASRKPDDGMVAALLQERRGYVQRGRDDRIAQVDEQLALHGYVAPDAPDGGE